VAGRDVGGVGVMGNIRFMETPNMTLGNVHHTFDIDGVSTQLLGV